jgi:acyl carrier protein
MIPSAFVRLDAFPLAPNGKVSRPSLPLPGRERPRLEAAYAAPVSASHEWLAALWQDVLRLDQVGIDDPFFELGGDSLLATQLISRVAQRRGRTIPLRAIFDHPTIAAFARHLNTLDTTGNEKDEPQLRRASRSTPS